jgi:hypothetical protein
MSVKANCKNCERVMAIMQEGMCGGCFGRAKGLTGAEKDKALAQAREDFKGRGPVGPGNRKPRVKAAGKVPRIPKVEGTASRPDISGADSTRKVVRKPLPQRPDLVFALVPVGDDPAIISIMVSFTDGDHVLFEGLSALSKKYRRSPDQQLLWLLEHELTNERLLPAKRSEAENG